MHREPTRSRRGRVMGSRAGRMGRAAVAVGLVALGVQLTGCAIYQKWQLNKKATQVEELLKEAQAAEAAKYSYKDYDAADKALKDARSKIESGDLAGAETALEQAAAAAARAKDNVARDKAVIEGKRKVLAELKDAMDEALRVAVEVGGEAKAPEAMETARNAVETWNAEHAALLRQPRQAPEAYDELETKGKAAYEAAREAISGARRPDAEALSDNIDAIVARLEEIDVKTHLAVEWASASQAIDVFRGLMENLRFADAYDRGVELEPQLIELEAAGRQARAQATLDKAAAAIDNARDRGAAEYAIEPLNQAILSYNRADELFAEAKYDEAFAEATLALEAVDGAFAALKERADTAIEDMKVELERAREEEVDVYAPDMAADARRLVNEASLAAVEGDHEKALQMLAQARDLIQQAVAAASRGRAQEALARIDQLLTLARNEGAQEYTLEALNAVEREASAARQAFNEGRYKEVAPLSVTALESARKLMDVVRVAAEARVREAGESLKIAEAAEAERYAPALLSSARAAINSASSAVAGDQFRRAFDLARTAEETAARAAAQSYQTRTQETLAQAREQLNLAVRAGAREHSPALFVNATDFQEQATRLLGRQAYREALDAATQALFYAEDARLNKIRRAQELADASLEANARNYAPVAIAGAIEQLAIAKDAMRTGDYPTSNRHADQALALATEAFNSTWKQRSDALIAEVRAAVQRAQTNRAPEKAGELYAAAVQQLAQGEAAYATGQYDKAYAGADEAAQTLMQLEIEMSQVADAEIDAINRKIQAIMELGVDDTVRQEMTPRLNNLAMAREAMQKGDYLTAFNLTEQIRKDMDIAQSFAVRHQVNTRLASLQALMAEYNANGAAKLLPERFAQFQQQIDRMVAGPIEEASYDDTVVEIAALRKAIVDVEAEIRTSVEERIANMESQLDQARREEAEIYFPKEFQAALDAFTAMRNLPRGRNYLEIYTTLTAAETAVTSTLEKAVVGRLERAYKLEIQDRVKEMNDLLNQFENVTQVGRNAWRTAIGGPETTSSNKRYNIFGAGQTRLKAETFLTLATDLRRRVREVKQPTTLNTLHDKVLQTFDTLVITADYFAKFGDVRAYNRELRLLFLDRAYENLRKLQEMNAEISGQLLIHNPLEYKIETELTWGEKFERWFWRW